MYIYIYIHVSNFFVEKQYHPSILSPHSCTKHFGNIHVMSFSDNPKELLRCSFKLHKYPCHFLCILLHCKFCLPCSYSLRTKEQANEKLVESSSNENDHEPGDKNITHKRKLILSLRFMMWC